MYDRGCVVAKIGRYRVRSVDGNENAGMNISGCEQCVGRYNTIDEVLEHFRDDVNASVLYKLL